MLFALFKVAQVKLYCMKGLIPTLLHSNISLGRGKEKKFSKKEVWSLKNMFLDILKFDFSSYILQKYWKEYYSPFICHIRHSTFDLWCLGIYLIFNVAFIQTSELQMGFSTLNLHLHTLIPILVISHG